jgi:hypothetical protein
MLINSEYVEANETSFLSNIIFLTPVEYDLQHHKKENHCSWPNKARIFGVLFEELEIQRHPEYNDFR